MSICQLSLCYKPITGGQEVYVSQLSKLIGNYKNSIVIQADPSIPLKRLEKTNDSTIYVKIPRGLGRINRMLPLDNQGDILPLIFFRELSKKYISELPLNSKLILHYAVLYKNKISKNYETFIISHGRDWDNSLAGKYRVKKLINAYDNGCKIICNDTDVANFIVEKIGLKYKFDAENKFFKNIYYLPNSYDEKIFFHDLESSPSNDFFLLARNLRKSRGVDLAILAFSNYLKNGGTKTLKIAGGPIVGSYFNYLKRIIKELSLENSVQFLGPIDRDSLLFFYSNATFSIVPSISNEGTSISALESMACGCPCLSTNVGGLKDLPTIKFNTIKDLSRLMIASENYDRIKTSKSVNSFSSSNWIKNWKTILDLNN